MRGERRTEHEREEKLEKYKADRNEWLTKASSPCFLCKKEALWFAKMTGKRWLAVLQLIDFFEETSREEMKRDRTRGMYDVRALKRRRQ